MAYFPNGTAGSAFQASFCDHCANFRDRPDRAEDGEGCPVYDLHLLLDQGKCRAVGGSADSADGGLAVTRFVLDFLIEDAERWPKCGMFLHADDYDGATLSLFAEEPRPPAERR